MHILDVRRYMLMFAMVAIAHTLAAQTSPIALQGRLVGVPDGVQEATLNIWASLESDTPVAAVTTEAGISSGIFVLQADVPDSAFDGGVRWWSLTIGAAETARTRVASVPYAVNAKTGGAPLVGPGIPTSNDRFTINAFDTRGRRFVSNHDSYEFFGIPAFYDEMPEETVSNWRGLGIDAQFYSVAGGPERHTGFGIMKGPNMASTLVWLYGPSGQSAFEVRAVTGFRQSPVDPVTSRSVFTAAWTADRPRVGIGTEQPADTLDVVGTTRTHILRITGGSDLAEAFPSSPRDELSIKPEPGMVLSIDPANPGALRVSTDAYDTRVAGVYSGGNGLPTGMVMGKEGCELTSPGDDRLPLAMTGRVWVYACDSGGEIKPGDRLTTSGVKPGHAMKAVDEVRMNGTVIGKAMTPVDASTGMVLVLVNLQ